MAILSLIIAYLLGSIPFGYLIVKLKGGGDIRQVGSGGTGATNVMRKAGKAAALVTLVLDVAKGLLAVMVARGLTGSSWAETPWVVGAAAVIAIAGHIFPLWLGFRAGKGVATGVGVFLAISPLSVLCTLVVFALIVLKTRYVSLGSVVATSLTPLWVLLWEGLVWPDAYLTQIVTSALAAALLIVARHTSNIRRLIAGTENKLGAAH